MAPDDFAAARYEALNERIGHVKASADRRADALHQRIDREVDKLDERIDSVVEAVGRRADNTDGKVEKVLFAIVTFSLGLAGTAAFYIVQLNGGHP